MPRARPRRSTRLEPRAEIQQNQKQQQDKSEDSEELEENGAWWNVEAIINERVTRRKKEYLVSWEGLQDSGEPWPLEWVRSLLTITIDVPSVVSQSAYYFPRLARLPPSY